MNFQLKTHKPGEPAPAFWIQNKGNHAGRPLRKPIPNCFAVYSEEPYLFEYVYCLWKARLFEPQIIGSVIPFIRKKEMGEVLKMAKDTAKGREVCQKIRIADKQISDMQKSIKLLFEMQRLFVLKYFRREP